MRILRINRYQGTGLNQEPEIPIRNRKVEVLQPKVVVRVVEESKPDEKVKNSIDSFFKEVLEKDIDNLIKYGFENKIYFFEIPLTTIFKYYKAFCYKNRFDAVRIAVFCKYIKDKNVDNIQYVIIRGKKIIRLYL